VTNYWPTRFLRTPRYKYHRNIAWQLDFPFSGDLYGSLSWAAMRLKQPVRIGERPLRAYIRRPPEELYDLDTDPGEVRNLAADPDHGDLLRGFRAALETWQRDTRDPWLYRDGISVRADDAPPKSVRRVTRWPGPSPTVPIAVAARPSGSARMASSAAGAAARGTNRTSVPSFAR
jgi:hypothetical protein